MIKLTSCLQVSEFFYALSLRRAGSPFHNLLFLSETQQQHSVAVREGPSAWRDDPQAITAPIERLVSKTSQLVKNNMSHLDERMCECSTAVAASSPSNVLERTWKVLKAELNI